MAEPDKVPPEKTEADRLRDLVAADREKRAKECWRLIMAAQESTRCALGGVIVSATDAEGRLVQRVEFEVRPG